MHHSQGSKRRLRLATSQFVDVHDTPREVMHECTV